MQRQCRLCWSFAVITVDQLSCQMPSITCSSVVVTVALPVPGASSCLYCVLMLSANQLEMSLASWQVGRIGLPVLVGGQHCIRH